jgi:hypothetical protein
LFIRVGSMRNNDLLSSTTARLRYGAAGSWLLFWDELAGSWELAAEVARLLESPPAALPPTVVLVAKVAAPASLPTVGWPVNEHWPPS